MFKILLLIVVRLCIQKVIGRGEFILSGKSPGKYQIKCTLMCEEYIEPQIEYIDFVVE